jgi:alpha-ribazole phosphatase/probable phosphoglycerate mutase
MNLFLIRHGEIPSNIVRKYAGRSNEGLTLKGISQAEQVADKLKTLGIHAIYSSPMRRAVQTAEIISRKNGTDIYIERAFREMEMGPWEGLYEKDVAGLYPVEWDIWQTMPAELKLGSRETLKELQDRVLKGIQKINREADGRSIVVITHVAIIRVLLLWNTKSSLNLYKTIHVPNAEIVKLRINNNFFS